MEGLTDIYANLARPGQFHTADTRSVISSVTLLQHRHTQDNFKLMCLGSAIDIANHPSTSLIS